MKRIKKRYLFIFMFIVVVVITIFTINKIKKDKGELRHEFVVDISEHQYNKVYLLDNDKYLTPLLVETNKEYLLDEVYSVISSLRDLEVEGFNNILNTNVKINKIELNNGILNIDFSKEFLDYQKDLEEKIIESLTFSVLDFKEIKGLTISVEGVRLNKMPLNGLVLPSVLNKSIGINKYNDMVDRKESLDSVILLYEKEVLGNKYIIPVTRRVNKINNKLDSLLSNIDLDISVMSFLNKISDIDEIKELGYSYIDNELVVDVSSNYLLEENVVDERVYEVIKMILDYNDIDVSVSFIYDGNECMVNGVYNNN